jgi:very-short-patch-repair endonuclease
MGKKLTTEEFIEKAKKVHGDKYDYSLVEYVDTNTKVILICNDCGVEFKQSPKRHLRGLFCKNCKHKNRHKYSTEDFIKECNNKHDNKYDYTNTIYNGMKNNIVVTCKIHGDFELNARCHLRSDGCPDCSKNKQSTTEDFIKKSINIHGKKYEYDLVDYKNNKTPVNIRCYKHGTFLQRPDSHLSGKGCPICNESKGEKSISIILENNKIEYIKQHKFLDCKDKNCLFFDFYLPKFNVCIEFDGRQHFDIIERWGGKKGLKKRQNRDQIKNEYCSENNIRLIRIRFDEDIKEKLTSLIDSTPLDLRP